MSLRIVFMGTPEFAVPSLDRLIKAGHEIAGVITAPDKPAGRGLKLTKSAIKVYAEEYGLPLLQPEKLKDPRFVETLRALNAEIQVVVAFRMLPEIVWNMPALGTINLHGSLLPQYRGAAPINWAIINGEKTTGVTTFKLQHEIDTGNILMQKAIPVQREDTAGTLHDRMKEIGADLLVDTLKNIENRSLAEVSQQSAVGYADRLRHAPKISPETCLIHWDESTESIYNLIRGLSPYPGAYTHLAGKKLKIYQSETEGFEEKPKPVPPGQMITDHRTEMKFIANDGFILLKEVQLEGKRRMGIEEFLRGWKGG